MESDSRHDRMVVRFATTVDAGAIAAIYNPHVTGTTVTFEEDVVPDAEMGRRIAETVPRLPWFVGEVGGAVAGYAYASPWRTRSAYRYSVETSIYMAADQAGRGLGRQLYAALLDDLRTRGFQVAIGGISLPNAASVALHERLGFRRVAVFPGIGWKLGRWVDVGYWQVQLGPAQRVPA